MNCKPILVIIKTLLVILCMNTTQAQTNDGSTNYVYLQGGYFDAGSQISGFGTINFGYLTNAKDNNLEGLEINIKTALDRNTIRSVRGFLDTIPVAIGGIVDYFDIDINYVMTKEYISSDGISFGLMSGAGVGYTRTNIDPRAQGGRDLETSYNIHIYTGLYTNISLAEKLSLFIDWNVFELSLAVTTSEFEDEVGDFFELGPFLDVDLDGVINHFQVGVMYNL